MTKKRIEYIDVTKAVLMICLLWSHYRLISKFQSIDDNMLVWMNGTVRFFATFFMQTFFILTGFCSSFKERFAPYLWKNVKTILIPGITLCILDRYLYNVMPGKPFEHTPTAAEWLIDGGPWFIFALFLAKLIYWPIAGKSTKFRFLVCGGVCNRPYSSSILRCC